MAVSVFVPVAKDPAATEIETWPPLSVRAPEV